MVFHDSVPSILCRLKPILFMKLELQEGLVKSNIRIIDGQGFSFMKSAGLIYQAVKVLGSMELAMSQAAD